ncbi:alpha/beta fold hydrolase [Svornostia abyssi]|uniref:Alpha/beta fold hydrolase n=1 Tax=Svornostia abyssi TaxID=2898438 RepID=A0ABY5PH58_9ACTN|nr:alpha/beta fold hydrolase [Parviterribacteraceae bacterium J379]
MPEVQLHGQRISYRLAGTGPALLLIHGITSSARTWDEVFDRLAEHHTVVAPDLPGHGSSDKPRGDYSPRGVRELAPRPARRARDPAGDDRRSLARRGDRDDVRLPVPRAGGAHGARRQRRAR